jgi:hypothetical protein
MLKILGVYIHVKIGLNNILPSLGIDLSLYGISLETEVTFRE